MADNSTEHKILDAAIECIEKEGIEKTTIRKIANIARVNSASINYYFRSKDQLIRRALDQTLHNAFDWEDFAAAQDLAPADLIKYILEDLVRGATRFPGLSKAHFYPILTNGNYDIPAVHAFTQFLEKIRTRLSEKGVELDDRELREAIVQFFSATLIPAFYAPRLFSDFADIDFSDPESISGYISGLVNKILSTTEKAYPGGLVIREADPSSEMDIIRKLFTEYCEELGADLSFQGFQEELVKLPGEYGHPDGSLYLARFNGEPAGCVALRRIDDITCEMKRLFVRPRYRSLKLGRALVETIIISGRAHLYKTMKLDTLERLEAAHRLYLSEGFQETGPYTYNPLPGAVYMELTL